MTSRIARRALCLMLLNLFADLMWVLPANWAASVGERGDELRPEEYLAFTAAPYDGFQRFAEYVVGRNGTRITVDYYRPTQHGARFRRMLSAAQDCAWIKSPHHTLRPITSEDGSMALPGTLSKQLQSAHRTVVSSCNRAVRYGRRVSALV